MDATSAALMPYATFPKPPVFEVPTVSDRVNMTNPLKKDHIFELLLQASPNLDVTCSGIQRPRSCEGH